MLIELLISFVIVLLLYQRWSKRDVYKLGKQLNSGVRAFPFIGHSYLFLGSNLTRMKAFQIFGRDAIEKENGLTSIWHGNFLYTMIADPETADLVLKTCLNKDDITLLTKYYIGNGSVFAQVPIWRPRRKILAPSFNTKQLKYYMTIFETQSAILVQEMQKMAGTGSMSAWKFYTSYTMDAIAESTMGYKMGSQKDANHPFLKAFHAGLASVADRLCQPWLHSDLVYTNLPIYKTMTKLRKYIWDFNTELIKKKRKEIKEGNCSLEDYENSSSTKTFLESLIRLSGGDDGYTDNEIVEEMMVIMVAGNDTSAVGSSFTSVMLSRYPEVQEKVYKELQEVFGNSDRSVTFEDIPRLKYLDAVILETMRLYPPAPIITRKVETEVVLPPDLFEGHPQKSQSSGITLVPGTGIIVNIWALHRNPRHWGDDVELFRPERFIDTPLSHPAAYMPFSYGPRNCVGYQYAMMSMKTVLSSVLRRFKILPATAPNENSEYPPLRLKFDIMMKDEDGFQIQLEPRCIGNNNN